MLRKSKKQGGRDGKAPDVFFIVFYRVFLRLQNVVKMHTNGSIGVVSYVFSMKVRAPRVRLDRFWALLGSL